MDLFTLMSHTSPASRSASCLVWQKLNIRHIRQTVQSNFAIPTMLTGAIDFYHFIPLSLTLTLSRGHSITAKQNLLASFSPTLFI